MDSKLCDLLHWDVSPQLLHIFALVVHHSASYCSKCSNLYLLSRHCSDRVNHDSQPRVVDPLIVHLS